jgi:hypothetical protein
MGVGTYQGKGSSTRKTVKEKKVVHTASKRKGHGNMSRRRWKKKACTTHQQRTGCGNVREKENDHAQHMSNERVCALVWTVKGKRM